MSSKPSSSELTKQPIILKSFHDLSFPAEISSLGTKSLDEASREHRFPEPPSLMSPKGTDESAARRWRRAPFPLPTEASKRSPKILLVDDLLSIRQSLTILLTRQGYTVSSVPDGLEAVHAVETTEWDLVLLDLWMPGMSGWEALRKISSMRPDLPILVMTAHPHQREWTEPAGAWGLMEKPLNIPLLLGAMRELAHLPKTERQNYGVDGGHRFHHWPSSPATPSPRISRRWGINE